MIRLAIFDLDGTLLDTLDDLKNSVNFALNANGFEEKTKEQVRAFVGNGVKKLIDRCLPEEDEKTREKVLDEFRNHYKAHMTDVTAPYPGIIDMLKKLKEDGYKISIVSNKFDAAVKKLSELYFSGFVDEAIGECEDVRKKPAPDSVFKAMNLFGANAQNSVYIGDSDIDAITAHNAGLKCIGVTWGFRDRENLEEAGADTIAQNAGELYESIIKIIG